MRERKLENYSLTDLVSFFAKKWKLKIYKTGELETLNTKAPCILQTANGTKPRYLILFRNSLGSKPHRDTITKDKLIHPQKHFEAFKLAQLEDSNGLRKN